MLHLESVIDSMMPYFATKTAMILASPVPWNSVLPAARYPAKARTPERQNETLTPHIEQIASNPS
jgi:Lrp/AsnC family transcriptional regulator, leucine-responsive regulatory protein